MKKSKILLIIVINLCIITGCKKYEEGHLMGSSGVDNRIKGNWELEYLYMNGVDSTSAVTSQGYDNKFHFSLMSKTHDEGDWSMQPKVFGEKPCFGYWGLSTGKETITIEHKGNDSCQFRSVGPFLAYYSVAWEIRRLTKKQLWLSADYKGSKCWMHFKKI